MNATQTIKYFVMIAQKLDFKNKKCIMSLKIIIKFVILNKHAQYINQTKILRILVVSKIIMIKEI